VVIGGGIMSDDDGVVGGLAVRARGEVP